MKDGMKVIGLTGGMSWESPAEYYRIINQTIRSLLGLRGGRSRSLSRARPELKR